MLLSYMEYIFLFIKVVHGKQNGRPPPPTPQCRVKKPTIQGGQQQCHGPQSTMSIGETICLKAEPGGAWPSCASAVFGRNPPGRRCPHVGCYGHVPFSATNQYDRKLPLSWWRRSGTGCPSFQLEYVIIWCQVIDKVFLLFSTPNTFYLFSAVFF